LARRTELSDTQKFQGDKAYVGEPGIDTPQKKTRSRGLTEQQKQENQKKARSRVVVEHLIRGVKTFRLAAERLALHNRGMICIHCQSNKVCKNDHRCGKQNYLCRDCGKQFVEFYSPQK